MTARLFLTGIFVLGLSGDAPKSKTPSVKKLRAQLRDCQSRVVELEAALRNSSNEANSLGDRPDPQEGAELLRSLLNGRARWMGSIVRREDSESGVRILVQSAIGKIQVDALVDLRKGEILDGLIFSQRVQVIGKPIAFEYEQTTTPSEGKFAIHLVNAQIKKI